MMFCSKKNALVIALSYNGNYTQRVHKSFFISRADWSHGVTFLASAERISLGLQGQSLQVLTELASLYVVVNYICMILFDRWKNVRILALIAYQRFVRDKFTEFAK